MRNKKTVKKTFSFHNISSPHDFASRVKEEAVNSNLKIEQNDADLLYSLIAITSERLFTKQP